MTPNTQQIKNLMALEPSLNQTSLADLVNSTRKTMHLYIKGERQMPLSMWEKLKALRGYVDPVNTDSIGSVDAIVAGSTATLSAPLESCEKRVLVLLERATKLLYQANGAETKAQVIVATDAAVQIGNEMQHIGLISGETFDTPPSQAYGRTYGVAVKRAAGALICKRLGEYDRARQYNEPKYGTDNPKFLIHWFIEGAKGELGYSPEEFAIFLLEDNVEPCDLCQQFEGGGGKFKLLRTTLEVNSLDSETEEAILKHREKHAKIHNLNTQTALYKTNYNEMLDTENEEEFNAAYIKCVDALDECIYLDPEGEEKYETTKIKVVKLRLARNEKEPT